MLGAWKHADSSYGTTSSASNICIVTLEQNRTSHNWTTADNLILDKETVPHELGHQWLSGGQNGHVDRGVKRTCHSDATADCIMSYFEDWQHNDKDGITEFCQDGSTDCIDDIRGDLDGK